MRKAAILLCIAATLTARDRIAFIAFYGYQGLDPQAVRKALPFTEGDTYSKARLQQARDTVLKVTGRPPTEVAPVCCLNDGDTVVFIGMPGANNLQPHLHAAPSQELKLPKQAVALYRAMNRAEEAAFRKGDREEDGAPGYRLSKDPAARAAELRVRDYAIRHQADLVRILETSSHSGDRSAAADMLGYSERSPRQMAAFVYAALDPDNTVRNDATRALGEILNAEPAMGVYVDPTPYIELLHSGIWTDRNKSVGVLEPLTRSKAPAVLARIQSDAWEALLEMAIWPAGWKIESQSILARIAGIPEERWAELFHAPPEVFLKAIAPR